MADLCKVTSELVFYFYKDCFKNIFVKGFITVCNVAVMILGYETHKLEKVISYPAPT